MGIPMGPIGFTSSTWNAVDPGVLVHIKISTADDPFTVNPWHCLYSVHWMLKAHQSFLAVEHESCIHPIHITSSFIIHPSIIHIFIVKLRQNSKIIIQNLIIQSEFTDNPSKSDYPIRIHRILAQTLKGNTITFWSDKSYCIQINLTSHPKSIAHMFRSVWSI